MCVCVCVYRQEVEQLAVWCSLNNLELNTLKQWRRSCTSGGTPPSWTALWLQWSHSGFWAAPSPRIWSGTLTLSPWWERPSRVCFLRQLRKCNLPQELLKQFYSAIIETVLCSSITVWFGSATKRDIRRLQRTVRTAERIIGAPLPSFTPPERGKGQRKSLWTLTPSSLSLWTVALWPALQITEHQNSQAQEQFLPQAISHLNNTTHPSTVHL